MKKNGIEIIINLLFWLLTSWLIINSFSIQSMEREIVNGNESLRVIRNYDFILQLSICIGISAGLFYSNFWNLLGLTRGEITSRLIMKTALLLFAGFFAYQLIDVLILPNIQTLPLSIILGIIIFYYTISITYALSRAWINIKNQRQKLIFDKKQAELNLLRSQLHPHFLFNVLNNLLSMVDQKNAPLLANSLDRLSNLLRYIVYDTSNDKVSINSEIEFIRNYAELQLLRFEKDEVDFILNIKGTFNQQLIEPGIFISFIENAFKYGTEPELKSEIKVNFDISDDSKIQFSVVNTVLSSPMSISDGSTGIKLTEERLKLIYPGKYELKIDKNKYFKVELKIETNACDNS
jgi:hypothetical protein